MCIRDRSQTSKNYYIPYIKEVREYTRLYEAYSLPHDEVIMRVCNQYADKMCIRDSQGPMPIALRHSDLGNPHLLSQ